MADIIITNEELRDPAIDDVINLQRSVQQTGGEKIEDIRTPFWFNPIFYYSVAGAMAALAVWALVESHIDDESFATVPFISDYMLFGPVAGMLGFFLGLVYGGVNRNWRQMLHCSMVGVGVGLVATIITTFIAEIVFHVAIMIAATVSPPNLNGGEFPFKGVAFFVFMCGRGIAWSIVAMGAGLSLGTALKSKKLLQSGFVGGMLGGLAGGLCFDPLSRVFLSGEGELSRAIGILIIGLLVGLFTGIFENLAKDAWFVMVKGPLAGKQFVIIKSPMIIGSSPKSDIYIFKDPNVAPRHASITKVGSRYILKDEQSDTGVFVNGRKIDSYILQPSDTIVIGEAVLRYSEKQRG